jgi:arginase family enzyme
MIVVTTLIRSVFKGAEDLDNDRSVGFQLISTDDIDDLGILEIVRRIRRRVGDNPVYLRQVFRTPGRALLIEIAALTSMY